MWTYTAYILREYFKKKSMNSLKFKELYDFLSDILWRKEHLSFHESCLELYDDLNYLSKLNVLNLSGNGNIVYKKDIDTVITTKDGKNRIDDVVNEIIITISNQQRLDSLCKVVEGTDNLIILPNLYNEYKRRIDSAISSLVQVK